ncbi:MAG: hypothetical protein OEZ04_07185 [Nitrospinota bacterium]|nr:hypothetical protein [Nitrospinota bacterium]
MGIKAKLTVGFLLLSMILWAGGAMAHGSVVTLKGMEDPAKVYGEGVKLIAFQSGGHIKGLGWLLAMDSDGKKTGLVGVAREETHHGRLVQATCMDLEKNIIAVVVMRVMEDEQKDVEAMTRVPQWWKKGATVKPVGAAVVLLKSVMKVKSAATEVKIP